MKFINTCRKYGAKLAVVTASALSLRVHMQILRCPIRQFSSLEFAEADGMDGCWFVVVLLRWFVLSLSTSVEHSAVMSRAVVVAGRIFLCCYSRCFLPFFQLGMCRKLKKPDRLSCWIYIVNLC